MTAAREDRDWLATLIAVQEGRFPLPLLDDAGIRDLLRSGPRIAVVGASSNPGRPPRTPAEPQGAQIRGVR